MRTTFPGNEEHPTRERPRTSAEREQASLGTSTGCRREHRDLPRSGHGPRAERGPAYARMVTVFRRTCTSLRRNGSDHPERWSWPYVRPASIARRKRVARPRQGRLHYLRQVLVVRRTSASMRRDGRGREPGRVMACPAEEHEVCRGLSHDCTQDESWLSGGQIAVRGMRLESPSLGGRQLPRRRLSVGRNPSPRKSSPPPRLSLRQPSPDGQKDTSMRRTVRATGQPASARLPERR